MKYPWVALSLAIVLIATTFLVLGREDINVSFVLIVALVGVIIISVIGLSAPRIKK